MPQAEVAITPELVRRLLRRQHPDLAELPITLLAHGWDNAMFRLGPELTVRLPRRAAAAELLRHEQRWLPELAPSLPIPIPAPVRMGEPDEGYPWAWSVLPWFDGTPLGADEAARPAELATDLGRFVAALHQPGPADAPINPFRGVPLADRTEAVEQRIDQLAEQAEALAVDVASVRRRWRAAVALPPWPGPAVWLHGDLHPLNLLVRDGRLVAVIDFGDITAGDPATDLGAAWTVLPPAERPRFRSAADSAQRPIDEATWGRARGWALVLALALLTNSADNPTLYRIGRRTLQEVMGDAPADAG